MATVVLMRGGPETGHTFWGHSNFMLSQDGKLKTIYGNFTYYSRALVHNEKNILLAENVFYRGYRGGGNAVVMNLLPQGTQINPDNESGYIRKLISNRFRIQQEDYRNNRPSIMAFMTPYHEDSSHLDKFIDITGHYYEAMDRYDPDDAHFETWQYYSYLTQLAAINPQPRGVMHRMKVPGVNTICVEGYQANYSGKNKWEDVVVNKGHHGPNVYPQCERVRRGEDMAYRQVSYVTTIK